MRKRHKVIKFYLNENVLVSLKVSGVYSNKHTQHSVRTQQNEWIDRMYLIRQDIIRLHQISQWTFRMSHRERVWEKIPKIKTRKRNHGNEEKKTRLFFK